MQIHYAVRHGDKEAVLKELQANVAVDAIEESSGLTPLMLAACSKHADVSMLELLIAHGANVNAVCEDTVTEHASFGRTAFSLSVNNINKLRFLLKSGADPFAGRYKTKELPYTSSSESIRLLLDLGFNPTVGHDFCPSMLEDASRDCDWDLLNLYVQNGCSVDSLEWNDLMVKIILGSADDVAAHPKCLEDLAHRDMWTRTPFLLSICSGDITKAKLLLEAGATLDERGRCELTVLDYAILSRSFEMLNWLISLGVDVNIRSYGERTPLMEAAENNNIQAVKILVAKGADVLAVDHCDIQAINCAHDPEVLRLLIAGGADANYVDGTGNFPLRAAVEYGSIESIRTLIELGANVKTHNMGYTALHAAANYDNLEAISLLLSAGAEPNAAEDDGGWAPLWWVKSREAAQLLLDGGASLSHQDQFGKTPFEFHRKVEFRKMLKND